ncbi:MAG TPA: hypothetical protein DCY13_01725 [Verrucomicrobiales bacterium]|nr:hypothetical protein [Verrucomicrobiales bacterium]
MPMKAEAQGRICEAVLMPHAPILIPEVGGGREREAGATVDSLRRLAGEIVAGGPDSVLVVSPHSPRRPGQFGIWSGNSLTGDMSRFGAPGIALELPADRSLAGHLGETLRSKGMEHWQIQPGPLDHGAFVPLCFLARAGWTGPTAVMGLNLPGEGGWRLAGRAVAEAVRLRGGRTLVLASGDMSHRLIPGAPAGYSPRAKDFDGEFLRLLKLANYDSLARIDPGLQEDAAEDVVDSTLIAAHAVGLQNEAHEVFSYEGPFGVGYCVARLFRDGDRGSRTPEASRSVGAGNTNLEPGKSIAQCDTGECLPAVAREAVRAELIGAPLNGSWRLNHYLNRPAGVFVTIRQPDGRLRGCRGTIVARHDNLIEEVRSVAVTSAFSDGRFEPLSVTELADVSFEVSVLHPAEPVATLTELDPETFGVIIATADGRRGLMLPQVEGLDTAEDQVFATRRKAGIGPDEAVSLARFTVDRFVE